MFVMLAKNEGKEPIVVECENEAFCLGRPQTGSGPADGVVSWR